jgi:hypothetical protein
MTDQELVPFDIEEFFDQLMAKLERAKAQNLQPVIKEDPAWVIAIPEAMVNEQITDLFSIMAKQNRDELELHYGNTGNGQFYLVTFTGVTKEGFVKSVMEIVHYVYGRDAKA